MKEVITSFSQQNELVAEFIHDSSQNLNDVDTALRAHAEFVKQTQFNVALSLEFIRLLQLSKDSRLFDTYTLTDVQTLLRTTLSLDPYNLATYVEAAHFEWNVMDDGVRAKTIIEAGLKKATEKVNELHLLLSEIDAS